MRYLTALLALLLVAAPTIGQDEVSPFFSLMSEKTFAPGEKVMINMSATEISALEFRVYKVKDTLAFFQQMTDPHRFGGHAMQEPQEKVPLERFHKWKVSWRTRIKDSIRAQFTHDSRVAVHTWRTGETPKVINKQGPVTEYAPAPVLNQQQLVATWQQKVTKKKNRWESQTVPVPVKDPGVYLIEAVHRDMTAYTVVIVSDLAMVNKGMPGRVVAYVVKRKSGEPVPNVPVTLWGLRTDGRTVKTNADGLVDMKADGLKSEEAMVLAKMGDHVAVQSLYSGMFDNDPARYTSAYIYTDRPVYRPGHEMHFKGILRTRGRMGYELPPASDAEVEIIDGEGNTVFKKTLSVSRMGTLSGDFKLPSNAPLGYYSINIKQGSQSGQAGFQVEEYKKPEYEVRITPEKQRLIQGEPIKAVIDAKYYYGEPVPNAKVKYVVHKSRYWYPRFYDADEMDEEDMQDDYAGEQAEENEGKLDADGKLAITVQTVLSEARADTRYRIEARVMDSANREIAGAVSVIATVGEFLAEVRPDQYVAAPGQPAGVTVTLRNYDDQPVQGSVHVELRTYNWKEKEKGEVVASVDAQSDAMGKARVTLTPPHAGSYRIRAEVRGPGPRPVEDTAYLWVTGSGNVWGGDSQEVTMVPDKKSYKPGETAKVLIVTGTAKANILLTTEARDIDLLKVIRTNDTSVTVEIPIKAENVPYVNLGASFIKDGQLFRGSKKLRVPPVAEQVNVELAPSKPSFKPGEQAQFVLTAKDYQGRPVQGEFSVGVVDEAIYAIRRDSTPDIVKYFYGTSTNWVTTENSLSYYFSGEAGKRRMHLTKIPRATTLAQLKPERLVEPKVRKAFPDTALWAPTINTDAQGRAVASLTFPDSLTTWRATARGITMDNRVGNATAKTIVRKDLLISLAVPRFFTQGDEVTINALVRNYLPREKKARVSLDVKGLDVVDGTTKDVNVPSKGEAKVEFRVKAKNGVMQAVLLGKALTDEESDAIELPLPVNPQGVRLSKAQSGSLSGDKDQIDLTIDVPANVVPGSRKLRIQVAPSVAGALFGAMEYLVTFPYGCTEQTMSSFLPNIVVARALREAGTKSNVDRPGLDKKIQAGLERLYDFQHDDGGWGWWKTDESNIFLTSYVLAGLAQATEAGQDIKPEAIENGKVWLVGALKKQPNLLVDLRAYATYALVLNGVNDKELLDYIGMHTDRLTPYGMAIYGLALDKAGDKRAAEIAAQVEAKAKVDGEEASWPQNQDTLMGFYNDTTAETSAYAMKLLVKKNPKSPLLDKVALWLMNHRNEGNYWYSTKQTAMVIYGLTDYLKMTGELKPNFTAKVAVNGDKKLSKEFTEADALSAESPTVEIPDTGGPVKVRVTRSGKGRLYWSVRDDYYASGDHLAATGTGSLSVKRQYFKLVADKSGSKIMHDLVPLEGPLQPGDTIAVRLTVDGDEWKYLMVEDPIAAGTEFIERDDLYELKDKPLWWSRYFTRREFHDDRAALFETYFHKGRDYVYLLKVVNPGSYRISPARVQPMYQTQYYATSDSRTLEVSK